MVVCLQVNPADKFIICDIASSFPIFDQCVYTLQEHFMIKLMCPIIGKLKASLVSRVFVRISNVS